MHGQARPEAVCGTGRARWRVGTHDCSLPRCTCKPGRRARKTDDAVASIDKAWALFVGGEPQTGL